VQIYSLQVLAFSIFKLRILSKSIKLRIVWRNRRIRIWSATLAAYWLFSVMESCTSNSDL